MDQHGHGHRQSWAQTFRNTNTPTGHRHTQRETWTGPKQIWTDTGRELDTDMDMDTTDMETHTHTHTLKQIPHGDM